MDNELSKETVDKRVADMVAHRTPEEMARDLVYLQHEQSTRAAEPAPTPEAFSDEGADTEEPDPDEAPDDELPEDDRS